MTYTFTPGMKSVDKKTARISLNEVITRLSENEWEGVLRWDSFRRKVVAINPPTPLEAERAALTDADLTAVLAWLNWKGLECSLDGVARAVVAAARRNSFNPVKDYLDGCKPGPQSLLTDLATRVFGCPKGVANDMLTKTLVGAVRRIRHPGCQMDTTLTLVGAQGIRKSTWVAELFGRSLTRSQMPDISNKDASLALLGFWAIELAELDRVIRAETSTVKEFLTRTYDDYRPPYGRQEERQPRHCVFIGTTNEQDFLRDPTGNRRIWPVVCKHVDVDFVRQHRDEIWGEACVLESEGVQHWFDAEGEAEVEEVREPHVVLDPFHETILNYCRGRTWVNSEDCYDEAIAKGNEITIARKSRHESMRVASVLKQLGCSPAKQRGRRGWEVPYAIAIQTPSAEEQERRTAKEVANAARNLRKS